ncbi:MAG: COX15/CtaA family protein [Actinobacteria bacterium]|nr:COX15/CtaA family protein [Actinomycetota bacterium]
MVGIVRYAWFVLVFNVGVILLGALVRATGSGAGCGRSWPTCQGVLLPQLEGATAVEFTHRAVSGIALGLVALLAVLVWRRAGPGRPARTGALLSVVAIVVEALIGAGIVLAEWVGEDTSVARAVAVPLHLVNTLFLLAVLTLTVFWLSGGAPLDWRSRPSVRRMVVLGAVALVLISATGAVTALADTLFPKGGVAPETTEHFLTRLRVVHPVLAVLAASAGWWVSVRSGFGDGLTTRLFPVLVGVMVASGAVNVLLGTPTWMQLVHLGLADILWIVFVWVSGRALAAQVTVDV